VLRARRFRRSLLKIEDIGKCLERAGTRPMLDAEWNEINRMARRSLFRRPEFHKPDGLAKDDASRLVDIMRFRARRAYRFNANAQRTPWWKLSHACFEEVMIVLEANTDRWAVISTRVVVEQLGPDATHCPRDLVSLTARHTGYGLESTWNGDQIEIQDCRAMITCISRHQGPFDVICARSPSAIIDTTGPPPPWIS
jgi:hypothetical protein